jgi:DNA-binding response OmpR family regulator
MQVVRISPQIPGLCGRRRTSALGSCTAPAAGEAPTTTEAIMSSAPRLNVLVVDPDVEAARQLEAMLCEEGYEVKLLSNPGDAVDSVRTSRHQLVILDVSPENPAGVDALREIREADDDLGVLTTTSKPTVEMAVQTMKSAAFHYLQKPIDPAALREVLDEAIKEKGLVVDIEARLNTEVGSRIREKRHASSLTLKQLANRTGLSVSLISQIELGKSAASMSTLHKLANALQIRMTYFFETV